MKKRIRPHQKSLSFQKLEPKNLLAGVSFDPGTGVITIEGSTQADVVQVKPESTSEIRVVFNGVANQVFDVETVTEVVFYARWGNDWFKNSTDVSSRAYGHGGDDVLLGGENNDRLRGGPGVDRLFGYGGNDYLGGDGGDDILIAGAGNDRADGFWGNDRIWGEAGNDLIIGGAGDDFADGGNGNDRILGYVGDDVLKGGYGADEISGNAGFDWISGSHGPDVLYGNADRDQVFGSFGHDRIFGGDGSDVLRGQHGEDQIFGGSGNDDLYGGSHSDRLHGGSGNDDFYSDSTDAVFDDSQDHSSNGDFELRGNVINLNAADQTFDLLGIPVSYANAEFVAAIQNGTFVKAEGAFDGTTLHAHEVELEVDDDRNENFEARGIVSNHNASTMTFQFLGFTVNYSNARLEGRVEDGANVFVEGNLSGSQIQAHEIESNLGGAGNNNNQNNGANGEIEVRGRIANLDANSRTFTVLGLSVSFSNAQTFGQFGNGSFIKVDGLYNGTTIEARQVEVEVDDNRDENIEARGIISNLDTNARTFEMLGFTVNYDQARINTPLADGLSIDVEGWFSNSNIDAEEVG